MSFSDMHNQHFDPDQQGSLMNDRAHEMRQQINEWMEITPEDALENLNLGELTDNEIERIEAITAKRLYKATTCGIAVSFGQASVTMAGYCEGSDTELPRHTLHWPFSRDEFFAAADLADKEGVARWDETHGCPTCAQHWEREGFFGEADDLDSYEPGGCPVWSDCPDCGGNGITI